jgi:putative Mn2+ efflux pump MntP
LSLIDIILLGIALGIDCFVVSFSQGLIFTTKRTKNSLNLAITMGLFQGLMPVIGYVGTNSLYKFLVPFSKWIVFGIFAILGLKFIFEAFEPKEEKKTQCIGLKCLLGLGLATSIDALVSGASIKLTGTPIMFSCIIIGFASFVMSILGFWSGNFVKNIPSKYLEIVGGLILTLLAIKALL